MAAQSPGLIRTVRMIDKFTDTTGTWIAWLNVPLVAVVAYEVFARYVFHAPTIWSFDLTYMFYGSIFMLGAAFALHKGAHIRTDFFYEKWSAKTKGIVDADLVHRVLLSVDLHAALDQRRGSVVLLRHQGDLRADALAPILWPYKSVVPLTCVFLLIQGVSELIKSFYAARTGIVLEHKEKIEV